MIGRISRWRHIVVAIVVAGCAALALLGVIGGGTHGERFEAKQITVWPDGPDGPDGLRIREVVDSDFGTNDRHGYERIIRNDFGVPGEVVASSPDANADIHVTSLGSKTRIRLGDPDSTVSGQHRYVLEFTLPAARLTSGQLGLDIIGTDETLETGRMEIVVTGVALDNATCSVGASGTTGGCSLIRDGSVYRAVIAPLEPGQGVTIGGVISGRSDVIDPALPALPAHRANNRVALAAGMAVIGALGAGVVFVLARRKGRNEVFAGGAVEAAFGALPAPNVAGPKPSEQALPAPNVAGPKPSEQAMPTMLVSDAQMASMATIEFVPPAGLQPWQGAVLLTERINDDTVAAWFSGLVASEAITLSSADGKLVLGSGPKRTLIDPLASQRLDQILKGGESAELGTYDPAFASVWKAVKSEQDTMIKQSGWWTKLAPSSGAGDALSASVLVVVFVLFLLGGASVVSAVLGAFSAVPLALGFGLALPMLAAHAVYRALLPARSATGSALALRTESFRRFLAASEGRHVDWAYDHGLLREYSAWAVSLGAADAWGKALAASNVPPAQANLSSPLLLYSMGSVFAHSHTAPSSTGSSSGSSSGGFSGGSVGGGGGGGSSGSW